MKSLNTILRMSGERITVNYKNSDLIVKRKINAFIIAVMTLIVGMAFYFVFQLSIDTPYKSDLPYIEISIVILTAAFILLVKGHFTAASNIVLVLILTATTSIVYFGETLNEQKIYNLAFLQSVAIIFGILVSEKRRQIVMVGAGSFGTITFFLFSRLLPAADSYGAYISTYITTVVFIGMETWIGAQIHNLLNSTLEEIRHTLEYDDFSKLPNEKLLNRRVVQQKLWEDLTFLVFYKIENLTELTLSFELSNLREIITEIAGILGGYFDSEVFCISSDILCVISSSDREEVEQRNLDVLKKLQEPVFCNSFKVRVQLRSSVLRSGAESFDVNKNISRGLLAIYHARQQNIQTVDFLDTDEKALRVQLSMLHELSDSIRNGSFTVVYQQLYNAERDVVGYEALSRWRRTGGQKIGPDIFIPMIEQAGLMNDFFIMMFLKVLDDIQLHQFISVKSPVFVNLSPELINNNFNFRLITEMIENAGIQRNLIGFEVTETSMASDLQKADKIIDGLKKEGFQIALDDFGMGYSNISRILDQSFNKIKFDKSFIENIFSNEKKLNLLESLLNFFNLFGYKTLIEGVETEKEYLLLRALNFSEYQGYFFSRPQPPEKLACI